MYKLNRTDVIATGFGAIAFTANEPTHVPPEMVREVVAAGAVEHTDEAEEDAPVNPVVEVDLDALRAGLKADIDAENTAAGDTAAEQPAA